jgi:cytosine/uracil/thiamine/allantoin permease
MLSSKKGVKIILLVFGLLPYIGWLYLFFAYGNGVRATGYFPTGLTVAALASVPILIVAYIIDIYHNTSVAKNQKILWAVIIFWGSFIAFPFYWYLHVWRKPKQDKLDTGGEVHSL